MSAFTDIRDSLEKNGLPILASALTGNPVGIVASIAKALGTSSSPSDVQTALKTDPEAAVKLATLEAQVQTATVNAAAAQVASVNKTLQTEAMGGSFWQRNHHSFETTFTVVMVFCIYFILPVLQGFYPEIKIPSVPESAWLMVGGILGVTAWQRGAANVSMTKNSS